MNDLQPSPGWEADLEELEQLDRSLPEGQKLADMSDEERRRVIATWLPHIAAAKEGESS